MSVFFYLEFSLRYKQNSQWSRPKCLFDLRIIMCSLNMLSYHILSIILLSSSSSLANLLRFLLAYFWPQNLKLCGMKFFVNIFVNETSPQTKWNNRQPYVAILRVLIQLNLITSAHLLVNRWHSSDWAICAVWWLWLGTHASEPQRKKCD